MKIKIDTDRCSGHGQCYAVASSLFTDDDAGYGQVKRDGVVPDDRRSAAEAAVIACPEQAIEIEG
jgi:ferredoxin